MGSGGGCWLLLRLFGVGGGGSTDSNVDLEFLDLLVEEVESGCDDWVGDFDTFQGEEAKFQFVQCARGGVLEGLNLEEEDRRCCVDAVGKRQDNVVVAECSAIKIEQ